MTVRISYDDDKTWPLKKVLHEGPSAYSNLVVLPIGNPGIPSMARRWPDFLAIALKAKSSPPI